MESKNNLYRNRTLNTVQIIIWIFLFGFPVIFAIDNGIGLSKVFFFRFFCPMFFNFIMYYLNYSLLINKFLLEKKTWQFLTANILILIIFLTFLQIVHQFYDQPVHLINNKYIPPPPPLFIFIRNFLTLAMFVGLSVAIRMTGYWYKTESERKDLEKIHVEAELTNLRSQINPHFLFNTLNNIYALISFSQDKAQNAVLQLSKLIRYVLYASSDLTETVSKEIGFLQNYIELMSLRLSANVNVEVEFDENCTDQNIAPLLLMPLVENAFKHGVDSSLPSFIKIKLTLQPGKLDFFVENSNFSKTDADTSGSGIGLSNLTKRLQLLYPGKYILDLEKNNETYSAHLFISLL